MKFSSFVSIAILGGGVIGSGFTGSNLVRADVIGTFTAGGVVSSAFKGIAGQSSIGISGDGTQKRGLLLPPVRPTLSLSAASGLEGNTSTPVPLRFTLTLSGASASPVSVNYATSAGTATSGSDYLATSGTLTIAAGQTNATIAVPMVGEMLFEPDETFALTLSSPSGAVFPAGAATLGVTGTILNDDAPPQISLSGVTQKEGNAGSSNFEFKVSLSAPSTAAVSVNFATSDGSATAGSDYTARSGTLTIPAGATSGAIAVAVSGDTAPESDENFNLTLSSPGGAAFAGGVTTLGAAGTITNDDADTSAIARDVSAQFTVYKSGLSRNRVTGRYTMSLVLQNNGASLDSPIYVALDGLSPNVSLYNADGITSRALPAGSPYRKLTLPSISATKPNGVFAAGTSLTLSIELVNPSNDSLTFTPRILQGPGSL